MNDIARELVHLAWLQAWQVTATALAVAETVLASATVALSVPVATPLVFVVPTGWVIVFPVPVAASTTVAPLATVGVANTGDAINQAQVRTNTLAQARYRNLANVVTQAATLGWIDHRGRHN